MTTINRPEFLRLLGQSIEVLLDHEPRCCTVAVKLHIQKGSLVAASVGTDAEREGN